MQAGEKNISWWEESQNTPAELGMFVDRIVSPLMFLSLTTSAERDRNKTWPSTDSASTKDSTFRSSGTDQDSLFPFVDQTSIFGNQTRYCASSVNNARCPSHSKRLETPNHRGMANTFGFSFCAERTFTITAFPPAEVSGFPSTEVRQIVPERLKTHVAGEGGNGLEISLPVFGSNTVNCCLPRTHPSVRK